MKEAPPCPQQTMGNNTNSPFRHPSHGGANKIILELIANTIDQYLIDKANLIQLKIIDKRIYYSDNGPGLPFNKSSPNNTGTLVEYLFLNQNHSAIDREENQLHVLDNNLNLATINAVSNKITIESSDGKTTWRQAFGQGRIQSKLQSTRNQRSSGTQYELTLNPDLLPKNTFERRQLRRTIFELVHLFPGLAIEFEQERFYTMYGLLDYAALLFPLPTQQNPEHFYFIDRKNGVQLQVATLGSTDAETKVISWANGLNTGNGGTHVESLKKSLKAVDLNPHHALIHVIFQRPNYSGENKDKLENPEIGKTIEDLLASPLWVFMADKNKRK